VLELIREFEQQSGTKIAFEITDRRPGDVASSVADCSKALRLMNWKPQYGLPEMCRDAWNWQSRNPSGFQAAS
jgi:UDP-glucose 4-epimerase